MIQRAELVEAAKLLSITGIRRWEIFCKIKIVSLYISQ